MSLGAAIEMIDKIRYNRALLKKPRRFDEEKKEFHTKGKIAFLDIEATPEQLAEIRKKLAKRKKENTIISVIVLLLSVVISCFIFQFLIVDIFFSYFFN